MTDDAVRLIRLHGPKGQRVEEPHITAEALAALLGITTRTVRKYARERGWPHARMPAPGVARYLFCPHDVDEIIARMERN